MVSQLSTSECVAQPATVAFFGIALRHTQIVIMATALMLWPALAQAQGSSFEVSIEPLTAIDQQFMDEQRGRVEQLANRIGRGLTGNKDRDLDTLQRILDERMVPPTDTLTLQAMGAVFGDLLGDTLSVLVPNCKHEGCGSTHTYRKPSLCDYSLGGWCRSRHHHSEYCIPR